jgi:hypothetical protein
MKAGWEKDFNIVLLRKEEEYFTISNGFLETM